jgi:hypothetical protein
MNTTQLILVFRPIIIDGLSDAGYSNASVLQAYQPTQQGVRTNPVVYFSKISDYRYGFPRRETKWDEEQSLMVHTETQVFETTFQINTLLTSKPTQDLAPTASDLAITVSNILQSDKTLAQLQAQGIGILRITDIRNPYFVDDRDTYEASPSFDFTLTHIQTLVTTEPVVSSVEIKLYPV